MFVQELIHHIKYKSIQLNKTSSLQKLDYISYLLFKKIFDKQPVSVLQYLFYIKIVRFRLEENNIF
jgi:hypothetical protein